MFDENYDVVHSFIEDKADLWKLRKSKYVQSNIRSSYIDAKRFLEAGRWVYFSGTPCQIAGLRAYLEKDYDRLFMQDLVCHGVPSPGLWRKYLKEAGREKPIKKICFRDKSKGWKEYNFYILYEDETIISPNSLNEFVAPFLSALNFRESCFECRFKGVRRQSDITLADFWGIDEVDPSMYDNKGTSLVITHSEKGNKIIHDINCILKEERQSDAMKNNLSALLSAEKPKWYDMYMKDAFSRGIIKAYQYYFNPTIFQKIIRKIRWKLKA